jgi:hypothetical protein
MGRAISDAELAAWREERANGLRMLENLAQHTTDPIIHAEIIDALRWHTQHELDAGLRDHATRIVASIPQTTDLRVDQYLKTGYRHLLDDAEKSKEPTTPPPVSTVIDPFSVLKVLEHPSEDQWMPVPYPVALVVFGTTE